MKNKTTATIGHKLNKLLTTPIGSLVKVFMAAVIAIVVGEYSTTGTLAFDRAFLNSCLAAGGVAVLIVVNNWLNPSYKNYGK